jgi:hypothetical protein
MSSVVTWKMLWCRVVLLELGQAVYGCAIRVSLSADGLSPGVKRVSSATSCCMDTIPRPCTNVWGVAFCRAAIPCYMHSTAEAASCS